MIEDNFKGRRKDLIIAIPDEGESEMQYKPSKSVHSEAQIPVLSVSAQQVDIVLNDSIISLNKSKNLRNQTLQTSTFNTISIIKIVLIIILILPGALLISFYNCSIPIFSACQPPKSNLSPLIVSRSFKQSNCYLLHYTTTTLTQNGANQSNTRTNSSLYLCVKQVSEDGNLQMVGYNKKISEEDLSLNPPNISYYDDSVGLESCLFADSEQSVDQSDDSDSNETSSVAPEDQNGLFNTTDMNSLNISLGNDTVNSSNVDESLNKLEMFRLSVFRNGTIDNIEFNTLNENLTIANIPKYAKLFFPSLDLHLYYPSQSRLLQQASLQNSTNGTSEQAQEVYGYLASQEGVTLSNQQTIPPDENQQVNSNQEKSTSSVFDQDNNLVAADMSGTAELEGRIEEPSEDYQVFNFNFSLAINQNISMALGFTYTNLTSDIITKLESFFIVRVVDTNYSLTLTETQLKQYLLSPRNDQENNASRLLLQADGSLKLFQTRREFKLLKTNVIGLPVVVTGIVQVIISLYDLGNYRKQPRFLSQALLAITLGPFRQSFVFFRQEKRLQPLSLSFTLEKIETFMNLIKGDFIGKIKQLAKLPSLLKFDSNFIPNLLNIGSLVNSIYQNATGTQNQLLPLDRVQEVLSGITTIKNAIDSQGRSLIAAKTAIVQQMVTSISNYYNSTYVSNLNIFATVRNQLSSRDLEANELLSALLRDAQNLTTPYISNLSKVVDQQLKDFFDKQLANLQPFFRMIRYVQTNANQFVQNITVLADSLEDNFTGTLREFIDEYYRLPIQSFTNIVDYMEDLKGVLEHSYDIAETQIKTVVSSADQMLIAQLRSIGNMAGFSNISDLIRLSQDTISTIRGATSEFTRTLRFVSSTNKLIYNIYTHCFTQAYVSASDELMSIHYDLQAEIYNLLDIEVIANSLKSFLEKLETKASSNQSLPTKFNEIMNLFYEIDGLQASFNSSFSKYQTILNKLTDLQALLVSQYKCSVDQCFELDYPVQLFCDYDGDEAFYYRDRVIPVRNNLTTIINKINQMLSSLQVLSHLIPLQTYKDKINQFSSINYGLITNYSSILNSVQIFTNESLALLSFAKQHFENITAVRQQVKQLFSSARSVQPLIISSFSLLKDWTNIICQANHTSQGAIDRLRGEFRKLSSQTETYNNDLFGGAIGQINKTLNSLSGTLLQDYRPLGLCNISISNEIVRIDQFINDTVSFQVAKDSISKLISNITTSKEFVIEISGRINTLHKSANKIANLYDFQYLLGNSTELVKLVRNYTSDFGAQISSIKEELTLLQDFQTVDLNTTLRIIEQFISFPSNLNALTILQDFEALINGTSGLMSKMNTNVIGTMLLTTESIEAIKNNFQLITLGSQEVLSDTSDLVKTFLNLTALVRQDYLIVIQNEFEQLRQKIDSKIILPILGQIHQLNQTLSKLNITENKYKLKIAEIKGYIHLYEVSILKLMANVNSQYQSIINSSLTLISTLKIGYMNELVLLGKDVNTLFNSFASEFTNNVLSLSSLGNNILKDIFKVKGTASIIDSLQNTIQRSFNQSLRSITSSIDSRLKVLQADAEVYSNLLSSTAYERIQGIKNDIVIDFRPIWSGISLSLQNIRSFEKSLTQGLVLQLEKLSDVHKRLQGVEDSLNIKIGIIKDNFRGIAQQFSRIERLIFGVLSNTIKDQVISRFKNISKTVDAIFLQDLVKVQNLASVSLPDQLKVVSQLIGEIIERYKQFKNSKDEVEAVLQREISDALSFISDALVSKFSILKDAQALIKSLPPMNTNTGSMVLFRKNLAHQVLPIFQIGILVVTPIGPFYIGIQVNFFYGCDLTIALNNFRNVQIEILFQTGLSLDLIFAFDIGIIRFGTYLSGQLMNIGVGVGFRLKQLVPVTLMKQIAPMAEFKNENRLTIEFYLYTQIKALSFEIGGFIRYLWFKLAWLRIRLCFRIRIGWFRIRICVRIRIPIIVPYFVTKRFGKRFDGIELARIKIFDLPVAVIDY